jgi:hypothetical protein
MSTVAPLLSTAVKSPLVSKASHAGLSLQRKCACGGPASSSLTVECEECNSKRLQKKLSIGASNDPLEQEADRVADQVLAAPANTSVRVTPPRIQRFTAQSMGQADIAPASVDRVLAGLGKPLEPELRQDMEQRFGHDFSRVRVHTGGAAEQSARDVNANAYTVGHNMVFGVGRFVPGTHEGRQILAHELTHVIQQGGGGEPEHTHRMVQRQPDTAPEKENEHEKDFGIAGPPQPAPAVLPGFGDVTPDAACPPLPTNLGRLTPAPPCPTADVDITGEPFTFCRASDIFSPGSERRRLITWARSQPAGATFVVHGYASESDGTPAQNANVSCHRAKRVARELYNAGVRPERIDIAARGGTSRFGRGASKLALNRVAIVRVDTPTARATPTTLPTKPREIVDFAVGKLTRGEYRLAADAYVARWTCGRVPSLAEAVRRSVIRIEGEQLTKEFHPGDPIRLPEARLGFPIRAGRNEIVLAKETFDDTTDPVSCVMARIIDLVFHHTVIDLVPVFSDQHAAAMFLIELAGLPPCRSPDAQMLAGGTPARPAFDWWKRPMTDPRQSLVPDCGAFAEGPLLGAITPQPAPATSPAAPIFTVRQFHFNGSGGAATVFVHPKADDDPAKNIAASGRPPGTGHSFEAVASVAVSGAPAEVQRYQIGFVQTIVSDRVVVDYVGGQRVRFEPPVPIRDGPSRANAAPPWLDPALVDTVASDRLAVTGLFASPWMYFPFHFMDPARRSRVPNAEGEIDRGNIVNRAHRATVYNTWLVARRDDAPLDRFSTHVLDGRLVAWTQQADFIGAAGTGKFNASVDPTPLTDTTDIRLGGPTPAEIEAPLVGATPTPSNMMRARGVVEVAEAPPKPKVGASGGLSESDFTLGIQRIAEELEPLRRALRIDEAVVFNIRIDPRTGRPPIHRPPKDPAATMDFKVKREAPEPKKGEKPRDPDLTSRAALRHYAEAILFRARKELVLADTRRVEASHGLPVNIPAIELSKRPSDVMASNRGLSMTALAEEMQLDVESEERRAANPGVFDPEFRVPVTVRFHAEHYVFDFSLTADQVQVACGNTSFREPSAACVVQSFDDPESLAVGVQVEPEHLGAGIVHSPVAVQVVLAPVTYRMFVPKTGIRFEGMEGTVTDDSLNHELHHLVTDHDVTQVFKTRLARAVRARVMTLRQLAASDRSLGSLALAKGAIEAVVWDEFARYFPEFKEEGNRRSKAQHKLGEHYPLLTEGEIQRMWPSFRMPARRPGTKGIFEP